MKTLKILDWPAKKYYGETHPFYKWRKELLNNELKIEFFFDHKDNRLAGADYLLIHSRYFEHGWQNIYKRTPENEAELIGFLQKMKGISGKLIWFDAADSTGSSDFSIISYVDVFLKKQVLIDSNYYLSNSNPNDLRIWLNSKAQSSEKTLFHPCPKKELSKIKLGWNLAYNDYRYFGYKMSRLSNYLNYRFYNNRYSDVNKERKYDLTFRGTIHKTDNKLHLISHQRNHVISLLKNLKLQIASGKNVSKAKYWKELRNSKISISPFGWGEICYRDFETFISGSLLVKPAMCHLMTFPNLYLPNETYIPVSWDLCEIEDVLERLVTDYKTLKDVAVNGQEKYKNTINDSKLFIDHLKYSIA